MLYYKVSRSGKPMNELLKKNVEYTKNRQKYHKEIFNYISPALLYYLWISFSVAVPENILLL